MRLTRIEDLDKQVLAQHVRNGHLAAWNLLAGKEGTSENYSLRLAELRDYSSPRHRHGFDQVRLQVAGNMDFAKDGKMTPGVVGYFPEAVSYGPHATIDGENLQLVLQFTGPSGANYISEQTYAVAVKELSANGTFAKGAFTYHDDDGIKHNKDGYLAVWEHVYGRKLEYAPARFQAPILMQSDAFDWQPAEGESGVSIKRLARFPANRVGIDLVRIDPGAKWTARGAALLFARCGTGMASAEAWSQFSAVELNPDEAVPFEAHELTEWLVVHMAWQRPVH